MKRIVQLVVVFFILFAVNASFALNQTSTNSPVGFWKTIDDVTGKPKAIIHIYPGNNQRLYGQILRIYPRPGYDQNEVCLACKGSKHNKRIVGMIILENLKQNPKNPEEWNDGKILDPLSGKTYHCYARVIDNGQKLNVRGYIGIALLGRTQTWLRVSGPQTE